MTRIPRLLSTRQAAKQKGVSVQSILNAARRGSFESITVGRFTHVVDDSSFKNWQPEADKRRAGLMSWQKRKQTRRGRQEGRKRP